MVPESLKLVDLLDYASGTADRNATAVDMVGFEWVLFIVKLATVAAGGTNSLKLQESADNSSFADLAGSAVVIADSDDNESVGILLVRPGKRYNRVVVDKDTTNACAELVLAVQGGGGGPNLATVANELTLLTLVAPAAGTP